MREDLITQYEGEMKEAMQALLSMVKDGKIDAQYRVAAAKVMDNINDSILQSTVIKDATSSMKRDHEADNVMGQVRRIKSKHNKTEEVEEQEEDQE